MAGLARRQPCLHLCLLCCVGLLQLRGGPDAEGLWGSLSLSSRKGSTGAVCRAGWGGSIRGRLYRAHLSHTGLASSPPRHPACSWPASVPSRLAAFCGPKPRGLALHCAVFSVSFLLKKERRRNSTKQAVLLTGQLRSQLSEAESKSNVTRGLSELSGSENKQLLKDGLESWQLPVRGLLGLRPLPVSKHARGSSRDRRPAVPFNKHRDSEQGLWSQAWAAVSGLPLPRGRASSQLLNSLECGHL